MYDYKDNKLQTPYFWVMLVKHWIVHIGVLSLLHSHVTEKKITYLH